MEGVNVRRKNGEVYSSYDEPVTITRIEEGRTEEEKMTMAE